MVPTVPDEPFYNVQQTQKCSVGRGDLTPPQTNPAALYTANSPQACKSSVGDDARIVPRVP